MSYGFKLLDKIHFVQILKINKTVCQIDLSRAQVDLVKKSLTIHYHADKRDLFDAGRESSRWLEG